MHEVCTRHACLQSLSDEELKHAHSPRRIYQHMACNNRCRPKLHPCWLWVHAGLVGSSGMELEGNTGAMLLHHRQSNKQETRDCSMADRPNKMP